jgi:hypothetical protein
MTSCKNERGFNLEMKRDTALGAVFVNNCVTIIKFACSSWYILGLKDSIPFTDKSS